MFPPPGNRTNRLAPPPREVPTGLCLALLCHRDVVASSLYLVPAAALLALGTFRNPPAIVRMVLTVIGAVLVLLAAQATLSALLAARHDIRILRNGHGSVGRIVACRLPWDRPGAEIAYADFLRDWATHTAKSQVRASSGCLASLFSLGAFFLVGVPVLAVVAFLALQSQFDALRAFAPFLAGAAGLAVLAVIAVRLWSRRQEHRVPQLLYERRTARPGWLPDFDWAEREACQAAANAPASAPADPLPAVDSIALACRVEYSPAPGERLAGEGRVRLNDRLDPGGVERLVFDPDRPQQVVLFSGLPDIAQVSSRGGWEPVPDDPMPVFKLAGALAAWIVATWFLVPNLFWFFA